LGRWTHFFCNYYLFLLRFFFLGEKCCKSYSSFWSKQIVERKEVWKFSWEPIKMKLRDETFWIISTFNENCGNSLIFQKINIIFVAERYFPVISLATETEFIIIFKSRLKSIRMTLWNDYRSKMLILHYYLKFKI
jgi:hypothetical protein